MLGLPDVCHAFVVFQRSRKRDRSRVTDFVGGETARIANEHKRERLQGIVFQERMRAKKEGRKRILVMERKGGGER